MIYRNLILPNITSENRWDVIDLLGQLLHTEGFVKDSYIEAVKEQEKNFPTALPTEPIKVAIPHTDTEHCIRPGFGVGILTQPVPWIEIATEDKWIEVEIVFLLAITNPQDQVYWIKRLVDSFQSPDMLIGLKSLNKVDDIYEFLIQHIKEKGEEDTEE